MTCAQTAVEGGVVVAGALYIVPDLSPVKHWSPIMDFVISKRLMRSI